MLSTKELTMCREPNFETVKRAKERKEYYGSLDRNKHNTSNFSKRYNSCALLQTVRKINNSVDRAYMKDKTLDVSSEVVQEKDYILIH